MLLIKILLVHLQEQIIKDMKETNISCMKYRKATHLSGLDVAEIIEKNGKCVLTIKEAFYDTKVDVAGKKVDGYFIVFMEDVKDMMVNSINRKTISKVVKITKNIPMQKATMINEWAGISIELYFNETVKFGAEEVGGIRVKPINPVPQISDLNGLTILNESKTLEELKINWSKLNKQEQLLPTIIALKDNLKTQLK